MAAWRPPGSSSARPAGSRSRYSRTSRSASRRTPRSARRRSAPRASWSPGSRRSKSPASSPARRMLDAVLVPLAHVGGGVFSPLQLAPPFVALAAYWLRARTLARQGRPVPPWRIASFGLGIALILVALVSPVAHIGGELILAHMAQHILLADLAALLM